MKKNVELFTHGPVARTLISMMLPVLLGIVSVLLFNVIDTIFASRLGVQSLAAISFTFPVVAFITALVTALSVGTTILVSSTLGTGEHEKARLLSRDALWLVLVFSLLCLVFGLNTINSLFFYLGAGQNLMPLIHSYMAIWYPSIAFLALLTTSSSLFRAMGDMRTPTFLMVFSIVLNTIFDPIFIFGVGFIPALGLKGAALAGLLARAITLIISLSILLKQKNIISVSLPSWKSMSQNWKALLSLSVPISVTNLFFPISTAIITVILAKQGHSTVAAFGAGARIEGLTLFVPIALCSVLSPFIAANLGAGNMQRIKEGINFTQRFIFIWGIFVWATLTLFGQPVASLFTHDPHLIILITHYLSIVLLGLCLQGFCSITISAFNSLRKPMLSTIFMAVRLFGLLIPALYIGIETLGITGGWIGIAVANSVAGIMAYFSLKYFININK